MAHRADKEPAMALPDTNRVIYARNPIAEVTASKSSPILRIEAEAPAQFRRRFAIACRNTGRFWRQADFRRIFLSRRKCAVS